MNRALTLTVLEVGMTEMEGWDLVRVVSHRGRRKASCEERARVSL